jgi:trans-aconitate methyltransferase
MISDDYKQNLTQLQQANKFKGLLVKYDPIQQFVQHYQPASIIDYGCAKGTLIQQLKQDFPHIATIHGYDPGVPEFDTIPQTTYDCLISNDVIEHFEPEFLQQSLVHMNSLWTRATWLIIACYPAKKHLPDGRNAHLIVETPDWWRQMVGKCFTDCRVVYDEVVEFAPGKPELRLILER